RRFSAFQFNNSRAHFLNIHYKDLSCLKPLNTRRNYSCGTLQDDPNKPLALRQEKMGIAF
ncbi:hypothetical protein, partial [Klebsiella pneumoniae]|uniref:hypothetical protein n=1 Tax=Klebsiella pneumoniae TaxID=573 RepID=UPI003A7FF3CB